jgi:hypothetical protein
VLKLFFFCLVSIFAENPRSTLNVCNLNTRFVRVRWICLPVIAFFLLGGYFAKADPVGDFFSKVGKSISKAFQPSQPTKKTPKHSSRRSTSPQSEVAEASPTPVEQPTVLAKEQKRALPVPPEKAKGDLPYGIPVSGQKGIVTSPFLPEGGYIDVSSYPPGSAVKDPYTGKVFLVP